MNELIVISLSPAVDRNYTVDELVPGYLHRCTNPIISPGGKGVNVARVLSMLGAEVKLLGFFAGENGRLILEDLKQRQIEVRLIILEGETRNSINIFDTANSKETEILEEGPDVSQEKILELKSEFEILLNDSSNANVIFSGGVPKGVEIDIYRQLIKLAHDRNAKCFLDTSNDALIEGVRGMPYFIKPNKRELSQIFSGQIKLDSDPLIGEDLKIKDYFKTIFHKTRNLNIEKIAITLSGDGAGLIVHDRVLYAKPIKINPVNTIGCGDSFTAGFAYATAKNMTDLDCLKLAVACASSNALFDKIGVIDPDQVAEFAKSVEVEEFYFHSI